MAVGNAPLPEFVAIEGIRLGVANAGIKKTERNDLTIIEIAEGSSTAAVFTQNAFCAAPVLIAKQHITEVSPRYLLINTGNANAGTGAPGLGICHGPRLRLMPARCDVCNISHFNQISQFSRIFTNFHEF